MTSNRASDEAVVRPRPPRIAVFAVKFPIRSQTFVVQQVKALVEQGAEVVVFCDEPGDADFVLPIDSPSPSLRVVTLPRSSSSTLMTILRGVAAGHSPSIGTILRGLRTPLPSGVGRLRSLMIACEVEHLGPFDGALAHFGPCGESVVSVVEHSGLRLPVATIIHGYDISQRLLTDGPGLYPTIRNSDSFVFPVSLFWARRLEDLGFDPARIHVHHMGVDLTDFEYSSDFTSQGTVRLASVGRMVEKKGFEVGIRAVASLMAEGHDIEYRIAGDGPLREHLESVASEVGIKDRIEFLGWQPPSAIDRLLSEADLLLAPSLTASSGDMEGIPVALMEAMAKGTLVVSTRHSGIPELIESGRSGWLAEEGDPDSLAEVVVEAIAARPSWPEVAAEAAKTVEQSFNWKRLSRETIEFFASSERGAGLRGDATD